MKIYCTILISLSVIWASGQESKDQHQKTKVPHILIGANFSPGVSFRSTHWASNNPNSKYAEHFFDSIEKPRFGFTTGLNTVFEFNKNIGFQSGVQYAYQGFDSRWFNSYILLRNFSYYGKAQYSYTFHNLNIPARVNFKAGKKKLHFIASAGLNLDIYLAYTNQSVSQDSFGHQVSVKHTSTSTQNTFPVFRTLEKTVLKPLILLG